MGPAEIKAMSALEHWQFLFTFPGMRPQRGGGGGGEDTEDRG